MAFAFGDYFLVTFPEVNLVLENTVARNGMFSDFTVPSTH